MSTWWPFYMHRKAAVKIVYYLPKGRNRLLYVVGFTVNLDNKASLNRGSDCFSVKNLKITFELTGVSVNNVLPFIRGLLRRYNDLPPRSICNFPA